MTTSSLQKMLDFHPVIYCVIDREARFSYVNKTASDILGYKPQELTGSPFLNFVIEQDRDRTLSILHQLQQGQMVDKFENQYYHKNGSIVTLSWSSQWDKKEQVLLSIGHPVSQEDKVKQLQQAFSQKLKHYNTKLSETFDRITDGFCTFDEEWRFIYVNKATEDILQKSKEELLAQVLWDVFPKAIGTNIEHEYKRCFEQQVQVRFEAFYGQPLDKWFEISAHPSVAGISVFFRDITERKRGEEEMNRFSLIVKHTDNLVMVCDSEGKIKWVNDAFTKKTGYSLIELQGHRAGDILSGPETDKQVLDRVRTQYNKGEPFNEVILFYTKTNEKLWIHATGRITYDAEGNPKELFSIQTDITERKRLEEQLIQEKEARQRRETAAVIQTQEQERSRIGRELHDNVNQLLTTVKLYLEMSLNLEIGRDEITKKSILLVQNSISEIRNLSKQLSAPTIGKITLSESVNDLCENIAATNKFTIHLNSSGIDDLEASQDLHLAVYRILQEHFTNVLRHSNAKNVHITLDCLEDELTLFITDDGEGFDPKQKRNGIGIHNMISRAESINGKLTITSEPGKGCVLQAQFPLIP
jgi:PAS domain S-box-containing protein